MWHFIFGAWRLAYENIRCCLAYLLVVGAVAVFKPSIMNINMQTRSKKCIHRSCYEVRML